MPAKRPKTPTQRGTKKKTTKASKGTRPRSRPAQKKAAKPSRKPPTKATKATKKTTRKSTKTSARPKASAKAATKGRKAPTKAKRRATADGFPDPNSITVQPMLAVPNVEEELRFLEAMGFQTVLKMPGPGGSVIHAVVMMDNGLLHVDPLQMPDMPGMPPLPPGPMTDRVEQVKRGPLGLGISIYVMVKDVDKIHKALNRQNATIVHPPMDQFWGDRTVMAYDPAGYLWQFAQHVKDVLPEEMGKAMEQMMPAT